MSVVVIGGGPAGAAAATLLAKWGHSVRLLTHRPGYRLAESLPPTSRKLLAEIGALEAVDAAGFQRTRGNTVWWGDADPRFESFSPGPAGYQVVRPDFDDVLLQVARDAGAIVEGETFVHDAVQLGDGGDELRNPEEWGRSAEGAMRVRYSTRKRSATRRSTDADWILDCSGRAGILARRGLRVEEPGQRTLSLYAAWESPMGWDLPDETHTLVESYGDGWGWSIPISEMVRFFAVMVEPSATLLARGVSLQESYRSELGKTRHFRDMIANARMIDGPRALSASPYTSRRFAGDGWLLAGDAGSFVDPLSSAGVKKALASGWMAAVVVNTSLADRSRRSHALELFESRERQLYSTLTRHAAAHFAAVARKHPHPFWTARAEGSSLASTMEEEAADPDIERLREDPGVLAAFRALREKDSIDLALHPASSVAPLPAVRENEVVLEDALVSEWSPPGVRYLRGVDLVRIVELAPKHDQVPDLYEDYNRRGPPADLPDFLGALSVLLAKDILVDGP